MRTVPHFSCPGRACWRLIVAVLALIAPFSVPTAAAQEFSLVGVFAIDHDVVWNGDQVAVTVTLRVTNQSQRDASYARVTIQLPDAPDEQVDEQEEWILGRFDAADIAVGQSVRLSRRLVIPAQEWSRWQERQDPVFRVTFHDDQAGTTVGRLLVTRTGEIPDER